MTKNTSRYPQRVRNELRFRELTVLRVERIGGVPADRAGGEALDGFVSQGFDDHTKLFFPQAGSVFTPPEVTDEGINWGEGVRPATRDYTPPVRCRTPRAGLRFLYPRWRYCQPLGAGSQHRR